MHKRLKALQQWIARFAEYVLVLLTAVFVITTWLLGFVVPDDKPTVIVLQALIGLTAAGIVVVVKQGLEEGQANIDAKIDQTATNVQLAVTEGFEDAVRKISTVKSFPEHIKSYEAMYDGLRQAKSSIDIISYRNLIVRDDFRTKYFQEMKAAINRGVEHKRIVWNLNHLQWLEMRFAEEWDRLPGLSIRFLPVDLNRELVTFDLIDNHKVVLAQGWLASGILQIESEEAAQYFAAYFQAMWKQAENDNYMIKEGNSPPDLALIRSLKRELKTMSSQILFKPR